MTKHTKKLGVLLASVILLSSCAVTLKQTTLHMKRDWLEIRQKVIVAYNEGKLDAETALEFINVDEAFQVTYSKLVDKILSDGDVSEDEIAYLQGLITAWRDKIP